jgi:hypothetical protein
MPAGINDLLHDAAVLFRFADFIEEYCREQKRSQRYVDASGEFFRYAEGLASEIKKNLRRLVDLAYRFQFRIVTLRPHVVGMKRYLQLLHTWIKPAADAHTLSIPAPLIKLASDELDNIEGMKGSRVVVLLTPKLMYFQRPHTPFREEARRAEALIPGSKFPKKLGFIELPYSQGPSFFVNLAIYHEIGHFVYEELSTLSHPPATFTKLHSAIANSVSAAYPNPDRTVLPLVKSTINAWTQELFCDLFAVRLIGPAFSFTLIEILGMLDLLEEKSRVKFDEEHPAPACRFSEQVSLLKEDSWWDAIADIKPEQKKLLETLANIPRTKYRFNEGTPRRHGLISAFMDSIVPAVRTFVRDITREPSRTVQRFKESRVNIENCLWAGVVPHEKNSTKSDPVAIINSAFCFYLTSLPELVKKYEKPEDQDNVEKHSLWTDRLEKWTMKAIEDSQIQKGAARWSSARMK